MFDYLRKPCPIAEVMAVVARATEDVRLRLENERLAGEALSHAVVLRSPAMEELAVLVAARAARRDVTVLVTGDERASPQGAHRGGDCRRLAARRATLSSASTARRSPPISRRPSSSATPRGPSPGASPPGRGSSGRPISARCFLDEIGEGHPTLQVSCSACSRRARSVRSGGSVGQVDVRVIASTHRDRRDRPPRAPRSSISIASTSSTPPPLRERPEDIRTLAEQFCGACASPAVRGGPAPPVARAPRRPRRAAVARQRARAGEHRRTDGRPSWYGETLDLLLIDGGAAPRAAPAAGLRAQVEAFERRLLVEAMAEARGNQAEAARLLSIGRATMHDKLRKHGIND